jgi:hypothetical protein
MSTTGACSAPASTSTATARASPHAELQHPEAACTAAETSNHHSTISSTHRLLRDDIPHAYRERLTTARRTRTD